MHSSNLWFALKTLLRNELLLAYRQRAQLLNPIIFFIMVVTLFPLAISPDPKQLQWLAPGVVWIAALLASTLALDRLFKSDFDDGTLELLLLSPHPLFLLVLVKIIAHWLISGLPLLLIAPLLGLLLHLPAAGNSVLLASLVLGTPILSLFGAIGVALTVGLRHGGLLLPLLLLPLYVPILIFGTSAVVTALAGLSVAGHLALLGALLMLALSLVPMVTAAVLRLGVN